MFNLVFLNIHLYLGTVNCLKYLKSGKLVSCSTDKTIKIWSIDSTKSKFGQCLKTLKTESEIKCLEELENLNLIGGSSNNEIITWNSSYKLIKDAIKYHFENFPQRVSINCLKDLLKSKYASCSSDNYTIKIWNYNNESIFILQGHSGVVMDLITKENKLFSCSLDSSIKIWNINNGECINTFHSQLKLVSNPAICLKFSEDGNLISGHQNTIKIWDLESGECIKTIEVKTEFRNFEFYREIENAKKMFYKKSNSFDCGKVFLIRLIRLLLIGKSLSILF